MALSYYLVSHGKSGGAMQGAAGDAQKAPSPPPLPLEVPQNSLSHPPFTLPCFRAVAARFVLLTRSTPFRARLFFPFLAACRWEHPLLSSPLLSAPLLSTPLLSSPLLCCRERAKARKAHTGSLKCLQAVRGMMSAVKGSLFQGRVNSLFILAFAAKARLKASRNAYYISIKWICWDLMFLITLRKWVLHDEFFCLPKVNREWIVIHLREIHAWLCKREF